MAKSHMDQNLPLPQARWGRSATGKGTVLPVRDAGTGSSQGELHKHPKIAPR